MTLNEALRRLDALVQISAVSRALDAPPVAPGPGEAWIVPEGADGAWAGQANAIASWQEGAWTFLVPGAGWLVYVQDEAVLIVWSGEDWADAFAAPTILQELEWLGLGTSADAENPFAAKLNRALWAARQVSEGGDGDLRYTLNKEAAGNTLSLLMQTGWSGRAEIGLTGTDDLAMRVSPDGANWKEALEIDRAIGQVRFPAGGVREQLAEQRTYYVRSDGSDESDGRTDVAVGAFSTVQKAVDIAASLDLSIYNVTIRVGSGIYAGFVMKSCVGAGEVIIKGDELAPKTVSIVSSVASDILAYAPNIETTYGLRGLSFSATHASAIGIQAQGASYLSCRNCAFGAFSGAEPIRILMPRWEEPLMPMATGPALAVRALSFV